MNKCKITPEMFRDIYVDAYARSMRPEQIAKRVGVSRTSVRRALLVHKLIAESRWAELEENIMSDTSISSCLVQLAAEFAGSEVPASIDDVFRRRDTYNKARLGLEANPAPVSAEPPAASARAEAANESVFFTRILEELHEMNDLLRDLRDMELPRYAQIQQDMKLYFDGIQKYQRDLVTQLCGVLGSSIAQTVNTNCDPIMQLLNAQKDALNGIKCNMRKTDRRERNET